MKRINAIAVVLFAFSTVCFGATLMQRTMKGVKTAERSDTFRRCEQIVAEHQQETNAKVAESLYNEAYKLSFNGDWAQAKVASECASRLLNGSKHWAIEARDLVH